MSHAPAREGHNLRCVDHGPARQLAERAHHTTRVAAVGSSIFSYGRPNWRMHSTCPSVVTTQERLALAISPPKARGLVAARNGLFEIS